jgi:hypothetical protein
MVAARGLWTNNCKAYATSVKQVGPRKKMMEILHHVLHSEDGEFAAMGTFTPNWTAKVSGSSISTAAELRLLKKFLRVISAGARLVMREYARIKEIEEGNAGELRQLSINQFTKPEEKPITPKARPPSSCGSSPSDDVWHSSGANACKKLTWSHQPCVREGMLATPKKQQPALRQLPLVVTGSKPKIKEAQAKARRTAMSNGLQWFSPYK